MLDYHIHTELCGHASGQMEEYVRHALEQPVKEIGFSDHLPMLKWGKPEYAMPFEMLPVYVHHVHRLQEARFPLTIKLGIEADYYSPDDEQATRDILEQYPFDYVYGSVHFIDDWAIDDPRNLHRWEKLGTDRVYERYFLQLQRAAQSGLFDIISHTDLVKIFGYQPSQDLPSLIEETVSCYHEYGMVVEINTSGLRRPVKEIYPSPQMLSLIKQHNIPIVFGSDAHTPHEVGKDFDAARQLAKEVGFSEVVIFEQRERVGTYPL